MGTAPTLLPSGLPSRDDNRRPSGQDLRGSPLIGNPPDVECRLATYTGKHPTGPVRENPYRVATVGPGCGSHRAVAPVLPAHRDHTRTSLHRRRGIYTRGRESRACRGQTYMPRARKHHATVAP